MKKGVLFLLLFAVAFSSFSFGGCQRHLQPEFPSGTFTPKVESTPPSCRCSLNVFIWWEQDVNSLEILQDAWWDFVEINKANGSDYVGEGPHAHWDRINMFTMEGDVNGTTQLEQQIAAGTAPDLVKMDHVYLTALGQRGLLFDLQDKWQATDQISNQFITSTWEACSSEDAVYGIPFDANTVIFGARTQALQQVGLSIPTNYEELQNVGKKMLFLSWDMKPYYLPLDGYDWSPIASQYMTWLWRLGGDLLNEDLTKATFNDPDTGVKALQMMLQLKEELLIATDWHEEEKVAMRDYGTWWIKGFKEDMEFGLQPTLKEGVPSYSVLGMQGLGIVATAKLPEVAYDFAVHLATEQNSVTKQHYVYNYCRNYNNSIPSLKAAVATGEIWNANSIEGEFWRVSAQQLELSKYRPAVPCWPEMEEALTVAIMSVYAGEKTPQQALDDAAELANRLLNDWHAARNEK